MLVLLHRAALFRSSCERIPDGSLASDPRPVIASQSACAGVATLLLHITAYQLRLHQPSGGTLKGGTMKRVMSRAIVAAAFAVSCAVASAAAAQEVVGRRDALQLFEERVAAYAELHQRLDAVFPPWEPSADMHLIDRRRTYLASAIKANRRNAQQGDIFEPAVAAALRGIAAEALRGVDVDLLLRGLYEECEAPADYRPQVHAGYPHWATHEMPFALLTALPTLPKGLHYRLIDHDLLLWDPDSNLIIDVLPDALPRAGS
jgi:hypothetical protein